MMSKFYEKYQQSLKSAELRRVKVTYLDGFEGFVLEENENGAVVYIVSAPSDPGYENSMMSVDPDQYEPIDQAEPTLSALDMIKQVSIEYLANKGLTICEDPSIGKTIMECPCSTCVESTLRDLGLVDSEILEIFKQVI